MEVIKFPSVGKLLQALDVFDRQLKDVNPYRWASVGMRIKEVIFIDWTRNELTARTKS